MIKLRKAQGIFMFDLTGVELMLKENVTEEIRRHVWYQVYMEINIKKTRYNSVLKQQNRYD